MSWDSVGQVERIKTREELANFIRALCEEHKQAPGSWENDNLQLFLEALAAWVEDMEGFYRNQNLHIPTTPEWKTFAHMLAAARYYE